MRRSRLSFPQCALRLVLTISLVAITTVPMAASKLWNWDYTGSGIAASGTFLTLDTPDASGGYLITSIKGARNGERLLCSNLPAHRFRAMSLTPLTISFSPVLARK